MPDHAPKDPRYWLNATQLAPAGLREIYRRVQLGETPESISKALGMTVETARRHCVRIRSAVGMPTRADARQRRDEAVLALVDEGFNNREIGERLGFCAGYISQIRRRTGAIARRQLWLNCDERAEIERRLLAGESTKTVALAVGVSTCTVIKYARPLRSQLKALPPCTCGRPRHHGGPCAPSPEKLAEARRLLEGGGLVVEAAAAIGYVPRSIARLLRDDLADMRARGVECRCGKPVAHNGQCRGKSSRDCARPRKPKASPQEIVLDKATRRRVYDLYKIATPAQAISRNTGVGVDVVRKYIKRWLAKRRKPMLPCACGRPAFHTGGCSKRTPWALSKRWVREIERRILAGQSVSQVASDLHVTIRVVAKYAIEARARLFDGGQHCLCGRPLHHTGVCSETWALSDRHRGPKPIAPAIVAAITRELLTGADARVVGTAVGAPYKQVVRVRRELSPNDRIRRATAIRRRSSLTADKGRSSRMLDEIRALVPSWAEAQDRDAIVSEVYVAFAEGRIERDQLRRAVRTLARAGLAKWGPSSLDAPLGDDGSLSLVDLVRDDTATAQLEEMEIGR